MHKWLKKLQANWWIALPVLFVLVASSFALQIVHKSSAAAAPPICLGASASQFSCWQSRYNAMVTQHSPEAAFVDFKANYNTNAYVKSN